MRSRLAIAGLLALCCATSTLAAPKKPAQRPAKEPAKQEASAAQPARAVSLENKRIVSLIAFEIVQSGEGNDAETIIGKLERPLKGGESVNMPLSGAKGCRFQVKWSFEDVKDQGAVDLCSDAHIVLID